MSFKYRTGILYWYVVVVVVVDHLVELGVVLTLLPRSFY